MSQLLLTQVPFLYSGAGSPEGAQTAGVGSIYFNTSGGASTTLYVKESGTGNTGWVATGSAALGERILAPVQDVTAAKALDTTSATDYPDKALMHIENEGLYRLDRDSSTAESLPGVIAPTTGTGRWFKIYGPTSDHNNSENLQGGTTAEYYHLTLAKYTAAQFLFSGTGTPEGAVTAAVGSMFIRTDGGVDTVLYLKVTGAGNTGWVAVQTGSVVMEQLTIGTINTVPALASAPIGTGVGDLILFVQGKAEIGGVATPSFTWTGTAVTWSAVNADYDLPIGAEVVAMYRA